MYRAWPLNAAGLRYLQGRFARETGTQAGELTITSGSAVLFDYDLAGVDSYLSTRRPHDPRFDPKGDWRFLRENGGIVAEHLCEGRLLQRFEAASVKELERSILPFISDVSHAILIGKQLHSLER
jgi:hypothetical protein